MKHPFLKIKKAAKKQKSQLGKAARKVTSEKKIGFWMFTIKYAHAKVIKFQDCFGQHIIVQALL